MTDVNQMINDSYEKKERKKKLHELLDKYGDDVQALENDYGADGINYMFAKVYLDEVLAERKAQKERSSVQVQKDSAENTAKREKRKNISLLTKLLPQTILRAKQEAEKLQNVSMSDENKHQYVSCVGAQGGIPETLLILGAGVYKEGKDLARKLPSKKERENYKGVLGILKDSAKDLKNDLYGAGYGMTYQNEGDCNFLLKRKIK